MSMDDKREIFTLLGNHSKLDRDTGLSFLDEWITNGLSNVAEVENKLLEMVNAKEAWEPCHGGLVASKCLILRVRCSHEFLYQIQLLGINLLKHCEARVRSSAGEVLGALCCRVGPKVYEDCKSVVLKLIKDNMERTIDKSNPEELQKLKEKVLSTSSKEVPAEQIDSDTAKTMYSATGSRNDMAKVEHTNNDTAKTMHTANGSQNDMAKVLHHSAGWQSLETSMKCLQCMIDNCGKKFYAYITDELLTMILQSTQHTNRFVREIGFYTLGALINSEIECDDEERSECWERGERYIEALADGLSDNWSQVRLAAAVATRNFFSFFKNENARKKFYPTILPPMCINRYYVAEGVRHYSQETWRLVVGEEGRHLVETYIENIIAFYILQTKADNHAVREAACICISELGSKIKSEYLQAHVHELVTALIVCFKDDSWPVRDASCVACGNFISCFPEDCRSYLEELFELFFKNLSDSIPSVRHGAAVAISKILKSYGEEKFTLIENKILEGLSNVKDQPSDSKRYSSIANTSSFGVVKRIRDNDEELHTDRTMYSCGSLAPKMVRGDSTFDLKLRKPSELWEAADGCVHLLAELSQIQTYAPRVAKLLPKIADAGRYKHYTQYLALYESVCKKVPIFAERLGKRYFKPSLMYFMDIIFESLASENALTSHAARECLQYLNKYMGPSILRGRVKEFNPNYLDLLDSVQCM